MTGIELQGLNSASFSEPLTAARIRSIGALNGKVGREMFGRYLELARELKLDSVLRLGGGEARSGGHQRDSILADALESVLGAVFLDGGYTAAREVILTLYADRLSTLPDIQELKDPKSRLQEALQAVGLPVPEYRLELEEGPPHARRFGVSCRIPDRGIFTEGSGGSRRMAEQDAAASALLLLADD